MKERKLDREVELEMLRGESRRRLSRFHVAVEQLTTLRDAITDGLPGLAVAIELEEEVLRRLGAEVPTS